MFHYSAYLNFLVRLQFVTNKAQPTPNESPLSSVKMVVLMCRSCINDWTILCTMHLCTSRSKYLGKISNGSKSFISSKKNTQYVNKCQKILECVELIEHLVYSSKVKIYTYFSEFCPNNSNEYFVFLRFANQHRNFVVLSISFCLKMQQ